MAPMTHPAEGHHFLHATQPYTPLPREGSYGLTPLSKLFSKLVGGVADGIRHVLPTRQRERFGVVAESVIPMSSYHKTNALGVHHGTGAIG
jgi:hypothetical protein